MIQSLHFTLMSIVHSPSNQTSSEPLYRFTAAMSCPDCFRGGVSDQKPTGVEETIHGLPTYVARPDGQPKGIIVYLPDAFGWKFVNNRVLADRYAKQGGYLVYLPECMNGKQPSNVVLSL